MLRMRSTICNPRNAKNLKVFELVIEVRKVREKVDGLNRDRFNFSQSLQTKS